ncbi:MAG: TetR/AcrR family transcriptional regulator [Bacillota bacterium]
MPRSTKRAMKTQITKQMLYESATRLFKENGFYNTTVEDIATAAGTSVGAFYYHFKCKEDLIYLMADDLDSNYSNYYVSRLLDPNRGDALELIRGIIFLAIESYCQWGSEFAAVSYSYTMRVPDVRARMINVDRADRRVLRELVALGQKEGVIRKDIELSQIVEDVVKMIRGAILDWCLNGGQANITEVSRTFVNTFLDGLKNSAH